MRRGSGAIRRAIPLSAHAVPVGVGRTTAASISKRGLSLILCAVSICLTGSGCRGTGPDICFDVLDYDGTVSSCGGSDGPGGPPAYVVEGCRNEPAGPAHLWTETRTLYGDINAYPVFANIDSLELSEFSFTVEIPPLKDVEFVGVRAPVALPGWEVDFSRTDRTVDVHGRGPGIAARTSGVLIVLIDFGGHASGRGSVVLGDLGHGLAHYTACRPEGPS